MSAVLPAPWLMPPVTATYYTPRARLRRAVRRFLRSPFAADVRSRLHIVPEAVGALALVYLGIVVLRGAYVAAEILGVAR